MTRTLASSPDFQRLFGFCHLLAVALLKGTSAEPSLTLRICHVKRQPSSFFRQLFFVSCLSVEDCQIDLVFAGGPLENLFPPKLTTLEMFDMRAGCPQSHSRFLKRVPPLLLKQRGRSSFLEGLLTVFLAHGISPELFPRSWVFSSHLFPCLFSLGYVGRSIFPLASAILLTSRTSSSCLFLLLSSLSRLTAALSFDRSS